MATVYRDYGALSDSWFPNNEINSTAHRQVYQVTHGGDDSRLPYMKRSFISFRYGGKTIEDFHLIATTQSNRISRDGYATFNDTTTTYDNLDGQQYWSTHYKTNSITFQLATDGIDQKTLDEFLYWFKAGTIRELILAEHPNRAILARVQNPPQLSLLPFEHHTTIMISNIERSITTTLFKGEITLTLIMDDPHWYAKTNILGIPIEETDPISGMHTMRYIDHWIDANGQEVDIFGSQDALKILYEDGIPLGSMIQNNMLLGNGSYAEVEDRIESRIWSLAESAIEWTDGVPSGVGARIDGILTAEEKTENPSIPSVVGTYKGRIAGAIVDVDGNGINELSTYQSGYFFYAGTAPSPVLLSFDLVPEFDSQGYFTSINSSVYTYGNNPYSSIFIESENQQELQLTTPNLITSYNNAVNILQNDFLDTSIPLTTIRERILDRVRHPAVRAWVNALIPMTVDELSRENLFGRDHEISQNAIKDKMTAFFWLDSEEYGTMHFMFNSKTGEAVGDFIYRTPKVSIPLWSVVYEPNAANKLAILKEYDPSLDAVKRYENLVTWGWDQYCISNEELIVPDDPEDEEDCQEALQAFFIYLDICERSHISLPTIFTVTANVIEGSDVATSTEDVGDMLRSNNLIIQERNYPTTNGNIVHWEGTEEGRRYSHRIYHTLNSPIYNIQILYQNMYL